VNSYTTAQNSLSFNLWEQTSLEEVCLIGVPRFSGLHCCQLSLWNEI
jgi:hypothetical protein